MQNFRIGEKIFIRTVTYFHVGEVVDQNDKFVALKNCSWVADTRRFSEFLEKGKTVGMEVEVFPPADIIRIAIAGIIDVSPWNHDLFEKTV